MTKTLFFKFQCPCGQNYAGSIQSDETHVGDCDCGARHNVTPKGVVGPDGVKRGFIELVREA